MLILSRLCGKSLMIGDDIKITVKAVSPSGQVKLGIEADDATPVHREEIYRLNKAKQEADNSRMNDDQ